MKIVLLIILSILDIICLVLTIYLWRTSRYPGAEIGNMDGALAKISGGAFLMISLVIAGILYFRK